MERVDVLPGVSLVNIPEAELTVLCGCPPDAIKHLMRRGLVLPKEEGGVSYESGPNAILLSDVSVQNGSFSNLAEFPVLQMLYRQGMLVPKHPRNTGRKPMLIGLEEQVRAQSSYIHCGNYGLPSAAAIESAGLSPEAARELWRMKLRFAYGTIRSTEELIDFRIVDRDVVRIAGEVCLRRLGTNRYQFIRGSETVDVDMNLPAGATYQPPYQLGYYPVTREYFGVIHVGEGDGWDPDRPCMGSIVTFQGRIYLVDAGPSVRHSLVALGISVNEIAGLFHTHCHDDHFAGLPALARSGHRIRYYAAPIVRATAQRKLAALMGIAEERFGDYFEVHDLALGEWTNIDGLEVRPLLSVHPVENTTLTFRTTWEGGYRSYSHLADLISFDLLRKMVTDDPAKAGLSPEAAERHVREFLEPADVKKIDIGGGAIHGRAKDFVDDRSGKLLLSHKAGNLSDEEKQIGSNATFGAQDVLIPAQQDYTMQAASGYLRCHLPGVAESDLAMLWNSEAAEYNAGLILVKKGEVCTHIHLVLSGVVEFLDAPTGVRGVLPAGSLLGELCAMSGSPSIRTFRTASYVKTLRMPVELYVHVLRKNGLLEELRTIRERRHLLQNTWILGEMISFATHDAIARAMIRRSLPAGTLDDGEGRPGLRIVEQGTVELLAGHRTVENVGFGGFWGEESALGVGPSIFRVRAVTDVLAWEIPAASLERIPIVRLKLQETMERRRRAFAGFFRLEWDGLYSVGIEEIDRQHAALFASFARLEREADTATAAEIGVLFRELLGSLREHLAREEEMLAASGSPGLERQRSEHHDFFSRFEAAPDPEAMPRGALYPYIALAREWILTHTLIEDRHDLAAIAAGPGGPTDP